jgi:hypothetical protein
MSIDLGFRLPGDIPGLPEDPFPMMNRNVWQELTAPPQGIGLGFEPTNVGDASAYSALLALSGLGDITGTTDIRDLNDVAALVAQLPGGLGEPDATGEVPTGSAAIGREQAALAAGLAAAPRIVEALGPDAQFVSVGGQTFAATERYDDPVSGLSALRLTPLTVGGAEVFAIDGTQSGSRADEVAGATLGRLQVESPAFAEMIQDAAQVAFIGGRPVLFVGASLGGAVAQVAAYETAETLVPIQQTGLVTGSVQLVTVDALGGRDAAEAINGGMLDPAALSLITALNVRTDGDIVSRIGSHIGATVTFPALDSQGNVVQLDAQDAHVNVVSLLQNLGSDELFAAGTLGAPAEIGGLAAASNAVSDELIPLWLALGDPGEEPPAELQLPGTATFDPTGTQWSLDADSNGTVDLTVQLSAPTTVATTTDLLFG